METNNTAKFDTKNPPTSEHVTASYVVLLETQQPPLELPGAFTMTPIDTSSSSIREAGPLLTFGQLPPVASILRNAATHLQPNISSSSNTGPAFSAHDDLKVLPSLSSIRPEQDSFSSIRSLPPFRGSTSELTPVHQPANLLSSSAAHLQAAGAISSPLLRRPQLDNSSRHRLVPPSILANDDEAISIPQPTFLREQVLRYHSPQALSPSARSSSTSFAPSSSMNTSNNAENAPSNETPENHEERDDDDILADNDSRQRRTRYRTTAAQAAVLWQSFQQNSMPSSETRAFLASELGMSPRAVQIWFQNRRQNSRSRSSISPAGETSRGQIPAPRPRRPPLLLPNPYHSSRRGGVYRGGSIANASITGTSTRPPSSTTLSLVTSPSRRSTRSRPKVKFKDSSQHSNKQPNTSLQSIDQRPEEPSSSSSSSSTLLSSSSSSSSSSLQRPQTTLSRSSSPSRSSHMSSLVVADRTPGNSSHSAVAIDSSNVVTSSFSNPSSSEQQLKSSPVPEASPDSQASSTPWRPWQ